ncbi:MAG: tetratricopeptide repeat protein [Betaproteobacteria bacterium AqS2]|uniref:Outer membrane protein assembly factor BamD n=1 Tax=Candidatus Amphirhobacter heronislandensis TaxID=1732024 RepID=A0A930UEX8_9GAMM|nr:tetratricopeptide repeat protein [Betaproteobacteria bacterium AqS2]
MKSIRRTAAVLAAAMTLGGCADEAQIKTAAEMYEEAQVFEGIADYAAAVTAYNELQATYPHGNYAQQAILNLAHLHYQEGKYDEALAAINQFIEEYPAHRHLDYARYLRGLVLLREKPDVIDKLLFEDFTNHSRTAAVEAYEAFLELAEKHPLSRFTPSAAAKAADIINALSLDELRTALHYLRIGAYSGALRRASDVTQKYPSNRYNEIALAIIVASLAEIQSPAPLQDAVAALEANFPDTTLSAPAQQGALALLDSLGEETVRGDLFTQLLE